MGVTERLLRTATARPPYLLVAVPGEARLRCSVESALRERGWPAAASPAGAVVLVVAGEARDDLEAAVAEVWREMPLPRARVDVRPGQDVGAALEGALPRLRDVAEQHATRAAEQEDEQDEDADHAHTDHGSGGGSDHGHTGHGSGGGSDHGHTGHGSGGGSDHGHTGHGSGGASDHGHTGHGSGGASDHGHMSHDMGGMQMPAGLGMADTAPDRDGLELDQLHVPLGPVLPFWPAGLVLGLTLQGDVVQDAEVEVLGRPEQDAPGLPPAAARLDALAALLGVLGLDDLAVTAARLRDDLLAGRPTDAVRPGLDRLTRRLHRSRLLRHLTTGRASVAGEDAERRWRRWLDEARAALDGDASGRGLGGPDVLAALPDLVRGLDVADVRLAVASLDVPTGTAARRPVAVV